MFFSGYLLYILLTYKALYAKRTSMPDVLFLMFYWYLQLWQTRGFPDSSMVPVSITLEWLRDGQLLYRWYTLPFGVQYTLEETVWCWGISRSAGFGCSCYTLAETVSSICPDCTAGASSNPIPMPRIRHTAAKRICLIFGFNGFIGVSCFQQLLCMVLTVILMLL